MIIVQFGHDSTEICCNMKFILALCMLAGLAASKPQDTYTTKYDNIDLDDILNNERLYTVYFNCLINNGKCTEDGKILKESVPDALQNDCMKCSKKQKEGTEKVLRFVIEKRPDDFHKLQEIYDPQGVYKKKYDEQAKKSGVNINN